MSNSPPVWPSASCHPSASIGARVTLGDGAKVGPHAFVSDDAKIGVGAELAQNVFVATGVRIGDNVKLLANVSVYEGVELEGSVFCGPSSVIGGVSNPRVEVPPRGLAARTVVKYGATIGANATVLPGCTLGRFSMVGAGATVTRRAIPDYALMLGVPARRVGWISRHGHRLASPEVDGVMRCPQTSWRYREVEPGVLRCLDWPEDRALERTETAAASAPPNAPPMAGMPIARIALISAAAPPAPSPLVAPISKPATTKAAKRKTTGSKPQSAVILAEAAASVPMLDLKAQQSPIREELLAAITRVVDAQAYVLGPEVEAFEKEIAALCHVPHAIAVSSGTDALMLSLMSLGVGPGDEVVTSPFSFVATAGVIAKLGAKAVFVDIDPSTFLMDTRALSAAITPQTKAIVPVHLFGQMVDMTALNKEARRRGVPVIEDAAQAIGADLDGHPAGSLGDLGCLSFFPSKNLGGAGDGGMVLTHDAKLAAKIRLLRNHGMKPKYVALEVGGNHRFDALQAAFLRAKLPHLAGWTDARRRNALRYRDELSAAGVAVRPEQLAGNGFVLPTELAGRHHVWHQYVIRTSRRTALRQFLEARGVASEIYYPLPLHVLPAFASWGYNAGDFPKAERAAQEALAIPIFPELGHDRQSLVIAALVRFAQTG